MTTEQTNNESPKKPRKNSKAAKRIGELEEILAIALVNGDTSVAEALRARIERLELGLSEEADPTGPVAAAPDASPATTWNDVVNASNEADANRVTREQVFDTILADLTAEERADLGAEHVAADAELAELTDEKKEAMADFKARIAKVESKKREIAEAITKKKKRVAPSKEGWICEKIFATNTRRYLEPKTGRVMCTEAMSAKDRQLALPTISEESDRQLSLDETSENSSDVTDPEAVLRAAEEAEDDDGEEDEET